MKALRVHKLVNVEVALEDLHADEVFNGVKLITEVPK